MAMQAHYCTVALWRMSAVIMILTITKLKNIDHYQIHRDVMSHFSDDFGGRVLFRVQNDFVIILSKDVITGERLAQSKIVLSPGKTKFSLIANSTIKRNGRRQSLIHQTELNAWFARKTVDCGIDFVPPLIKVLEPVRSNGMTLNRVLFSGLCTVTHTEKAGEFIERGVGPAKGFGFGLILLESMLCQLKVKQQ